MFPIVYRKIMDREYLSCAIRYVECLAIYNKDDYGYAASLGYSVKRVSFIAFMVILELMEFNPNIIHALLNTCQMFVIAGHFFIQYSTVYMCLLCICSVVIETLHMET